MDNINSALYILFLLIGIPTVGFVLQKPSTKTGGYDEPPQLEETVPFVSNAFDFLIRKRAFVVRLRRSLKASPRGVVRCRLGPLNVYMVGGSDNVSALFRPAFSADPWFLRVFEHTAGYERADVAKFEKDTSGGTKLPRAGHEQPPENRIWYEMHSMYNDSLIPEMPIKTFCSGFQAAFAKELPTPREWAEVRVFQFLKHHMFKAATIAIFGPRILDINPGFIDAFWEYEKYAEALSFGLPFNRRATRARDTFNSMCGKWFEMADREFDWEKVDASQDEEFEPVFGARLSRQLAQWGKSFGFSRKTMGGVYGLVFFGVHSNTISICTWIMMELIRDPDLFHAIKTEVSTAAPAAQDPKAEEEPFDTQKLLSLPLLQSVFVEAMRLHASVLLTRTCIEDVNLAGYMIPRGSIMQTPTEVSHLDEDIWGTPEHPASEFWAARHVKEVETKDENGTSSTRLEFSLAGRTKSFLPYGGGISMCPGRNFAKPEVLLAVAMMVTRLEVDLGSATWLKTDGSVSERPARDLEAGTNAIVSPPDRDLRVKVRAV